jgi:hypothetical protein
MRKLTAEDIVVTSGVVTTYDLAFDIADVGDVISRANEEDTLRWVRLQNKTKE